MAEIFYNNIDGVKVPFTAEEQAEKIASDAAWEAEAPDRAFFKLREKRNKRLAETDWQANSDVDMGANVASYRQKLRDLPAQYNNETILGSIVWPVKPE